MKNPVKQIIAPLISFVILIGMSNIVMGQILESDGDAYITGKLGVGQDVPEQKVDIRGDSPDDGALLLLGNSDLSHKLMFFPGRINDPLPFILWREGDPLRFVTDEGGFNERFRIASDGTITVQNRITNAADLVDAQDAATKNYVDEIVEMMREQDLNAGLYGVVDDIDGNSYKTIKIGDQVWMAENLKTRKYNDGTAIPLVTDSVDWVLRTEPGYSWYDNDSAAHATSYGALYNFYAVGDTNTRNVCPEGWDIPTDTAWMMLVDYLDDNGYGFEGGGDDVAKSMAQTFGWENDVVVGYVGNDQGTNNGSRFSTAPGGFRSSVSGEYSNKVSQGYWWTSTPFPPTHSWYQYMFSSSNMLQKSIATRKIGCSVRCIRDD